VSLRYQLRNEGCLQRLSLLNVTRSGNASVVVTAGAASASAATGADATVIPVANVFGFSDGQTFTIDSGECLRRDSRRCHLACRLSGNQQSLVFIMVAEAMSNESGF
jgi:hypothetical protein